VKVLATAVHAASRQLLRVLRRCWRLQAFVAVPLGQAEPSPQLVSRGLQLKEYRRSTETEWPTTRLLKKLGNRAGRRQKNVSQLRSQNMQMTRCAKHVPRCSSVEDTGKISLHTSLRRPALILEVIERGSATRLGELPISAHRPRSANVAWYPKRGSSRSF